MAGYLYASIGFFWLCTVLSAFFLVFIPFAYLFVGDDRHLIRRQQNHIESESSIKDSDTIIIVVQDDASSVSIDTVTVVTSKQKEQRLEKD